MFFVECSNIKTIKGDLIPYLVRQQFVDKKPSVQNDDTSWGRSIFVFHIFVSFNTSSALTLLIG